MKNIKWSAMFISIAYIVAGVLFFIFPAIGEAQLTVWIGYAAIIMGIYNCVAYVIRSKQKSVFKNDFMIGLLLITIGFIILVDLNYFYDLVYYILAIIIMLSGYSKLQDCVDAWRLKTHNGFMFFVLALISIAIGALIIVGVQYAWVMNVDLFIGVGLIFSGVSDFAVAIMLSIKMISDSKKEKQIEQAKPETIENLSTREEVYVQEENQPQYDQTIVDDENKNPEV